VDSSLILLLVVGLSLSQLVPHALRRRQQLSSCRSVDRFSGAMRVLSPRTRPRTTLPGAARRPLLLTSPRLDLRPDLAAHDPAAHHPAAHHPAAGRSGQGVLSTSAVRVVADGRARSGGGAAVVLPVSVLVLSVVMLVLLAALVQQSALPPWALGAGTGQVGLVLLALRVRARRRTRSRRVPSQRVVGRPLPGRLLPPVTVRPTAQAGAADHPPAATEPVRELVLARRPA
jgi:hypothetical protein